MIHHRGNDGKPADARWHAFRERARSTAFSAEAFSDADRTRYDLDDDDPRSAGITGEDNPATYDVTDQQDPSQSADMRDAPYR